jgi:hypothetical protein
LYIVLLANQNAQLEVRGHVFLGLDRFQLHFFFVIQDRTNLKFDTMFETGVDEMPWDDTVSYMYPPRVT